MGVASVREWVVEASPEDQHQINTDIDRHTHRQTDRQRDRPTERERERERQTDRQRHKGWVCLCVF